MFGVDFLLGHPVRRLATDPAAPEIFLSFDDGPDPVATPKVLDLLERHSARASFFVVGQKARAEPGLVREIVARGHAIGNHSWDHRYGVFFRGRRAMKDWIERAETNLHELGVEASVGFRPPVGIRTPELAWALRELRIPLVLWNERAFDQVRILTPEFAEKWAKRTRPGSIVLLHDAQSAERIVPFISALEHFLRGARGRDIKLSPLDRTRVDSTNL